MHSFLLAMTQEIDQVDYSECINSSSNANQFHDDNLGAFSSYRHRIQNLEQRLQHLETLIQR